MVDLYTCKHGQSGDPCDDCDAEQDSEDIDRLCSRGFLVLSPGDTSPLGEALRAAVACNNSSSRRFSIRSLAMLLEAGGDPAIRAWAERKP